VDITRYFEIKQGKAPLILSVPHGGFLKPKIISNKIKGFNIADRGTYLIAKGILNLLAKENIDISYILSKIHRSKIDFNRPPRGHEAFNQDASSVNLTKTLHSSYHQYLQDFTKKHISNFNKCLFIDFHGFTKPSRQDYPDIIIGNLFGNSLNIPADTNPKKNQHWGYSHLIEQLSKHFNLDNGLGKNEYNLAYSGGYITYQFYNKEKVNAFQLEISDDIRKDLGRLRLFIEDFIQAIKNSLDTH